MKRAVENEARSYLLEMTPKLRGYLRMMLGSRQDAEDVVQDVFVKFLRHGPAPRTDHADAWLFTAARNGALNLLRGRKRRMVRERRYLELVDSGQPSPLEVARRRESHQRIDECMRKLPRPMREILYLNVVEKLSVREIGTRVGLSKSTVAERVREGLIALNRCFHGADTSAGE